jgi:hypothetical protein
MRLNLNARKSFAVQMWHMLSTQHRLEVNALQKSGHRTFSLKKTNSD